MRGQNHKPCRLPLRGMGTSTASTMALFSASESVYLSSFLSSVDLDSSVNHDGSVDPGLADQIPHLQGSEALAKATKDLMSLDVPLASARDGQPNHPHLHPPGGPSYWPSFPQGEQPSAALSGQQAHTFPQDVRPSSPAHYLNRALSGGATSADPLRSGSQGERGNSSVFTSHLGQQAQQHPQIAPLRGFDPSSSSSSGYTLPPISTSGYSNGLTSHDGQRPSVSSAASAPSVLSPSTKRPLPSSAEPATDPSSSKRPRPSPSSTSFPSANGADSAAAGSSSGSRARHNSSSAAPRRGTPANERKPSHGDKDAARNSANSKDAKERENKDADKDKGSSGANNSSKGALLSPSQKRANHIQSEQKRRANIRRGYEALCETVPALREAIRAEEERERAEADEDAKGKGRAASGAERGKKKRKSESERADGRAGPRSENVVLQKSMCSSFAALNSGLTWCSFVCSD